MADNTLNTIGVMMPDKLALFPGVVALLFRLESPTRIGPAFIAAGLLVPPRLTITHPTDLADSVIFTLLRAIDGVLLVPLPGLFRELLPTFLTQSEARLVSPVS